MTPWQRIVAHAVAHLPNGIEERRQELVALHDVMPLREPEREQVADLLAVLDSHMAAQRELALGCSLGPAAPAA